MVSSTDTKGNKKKVALKETPISLRIVCAVLFFALGYFLSKKILFPNLLLFGTHTVVEVLVGGGLSVFGYFIFPLLLLKVKHWFEGLVVATVSSIVNAFWDQQSKRIQKARRDKQKMKADENSLKEKQEMENAILLDTSVLVDGRLLDIVKAGFMDRPFIIPQNVINELQKLSDAKNKTKRTRGRMGLDLVKELKKRTKILIPDIKTKEKEVDRILVDYAKEKKVKLMTLDFNLNKVAKVSGIKVLNMNDLVNALKTVMLPGEDFIVKVLQQGKEKKQGIGYLSDGTMVVIENGTDKVGQDVTVRVLKVIQSSAGKIVFGEITSK